MLLVSRAREEELLADALSREHKPLTNREARIETAFAIGFLAVAGLLAFLSPGGRFEWIPSLACIATLAVATQVRFHVASGFTVPTQLAYVPLLFAVPVAFTPLAVALALMLGRAPSVISGKARLTRLIPCAGNSWFSIGPSALFLAAGVTPAEAGAPLLLAALVAQFLVDAAASGIREALLDGMSLRDQVREWWIYGVDAALAPVALVVAVHVNDTPPGVLALIPLLAVLAIFARERQARLAAIIELKDAYQGTALVLADVVEADDSYTGEHSQTVVQLAREVGPRMGLDPESLRNLEFGALLHDVGKVAIPNEIINKPGVLEAHEWTIIKTHTIEGQRMLNQVGGFMRKVGLIVRSHHERWDGGGYPDGLKGDEIPIESRIIACCDSWNAMRTDRPYRKALPPGDALKELRRAAGSQFDPMVVSVLIDVVDHGSRHRATSAESTSVREAPALSH
jgi:putative nucleotidyltransferase with HDIG domain